MPSLASNTIASTFKSLLKLQVVTGDLSSYTGSNAAIIQTGDSEDTPLRMTTQRIGIMQSTPTATLNVVCNEAEISTLYAYTAQTNTTAPAFYFNQQSTGNNQECLKITSKGTGAALSVYDNTTSTFIVLDGGNVGISVADPDEKLEVNGNIKFTGASGQGISWAPTGYGGSSSASTSELLDDYEEGTWVPTNSNQALTLNHTPHNYVKIGNMCIAWFDVTWAAVGDASQSGGVINGLPYACKNISGVASCQLPVLYQLFADATTGAMETVSDREVFIQANSTTMNIYKRSTGTVVTRAQMDNDRMHGMAIYPTT